MITTEEVACRDLFLLSIAASNVDSVINRSTSNTKWSPILKLSIPTKRIKIFPRKYICIQAWKKIKNSLNKLFSFNRVPGKQNQFLLKTKQAIWIRESPNNKEETTWSSFFYSKQNRRNWTPQREDKEHNLRLKFFLQRIKSNKYKVFEKEKGVWKLRREEREGVKKVRKLYIYEQ